MNRFANPVVKWILRSRLHRLLSAHLLLISVTGRRTGRVYTIPVGYHLRGDIHAVEDKGEVHAHAGPFGH